MASGRLGDSEGANWSDTAAFATKHKRLKAKYMRSPHHHFGPCHFAVTIPEFVLF